MIESPTSEALILEGIRREQGVFRLGATLSGLISWFDAYNRSYPSAAELQNAIAPLEAAEYVRPWFGRIRLTKKFYRKHREISRTHTDSSAFERCQVILDAIEQVNQKGGNSSLNKIVSSGRWKKALSNYTASR
ncbi:MAG: hypothetical protein HWE14_06430 [Flavobacteriia bacterium]|nr:hypothetical protein [Flavobacteriia bacterium]